MKSSVKTSFSILFDSIGCMIDKHADEEDVQFFVVSDGENLNFKKNVYEASDVADAVERQRSGKNWKFRFIGSIAQHLEKRLKKDATNMGFKENEITMLRHTEEALGKAFKKTRTKLVKAFFMDGSFSPRKVARKQSHSNKRKKSNRRNGLTRKTNKFLG